MVGVKAWVILGTFSQKQENNVRVCSVLQNEPEYAFN